MIGRQTAMGGILMVGARLLTRVIDLVTMLVLARLLDPTDFGLVAIATSVVVVVESALDLPLNQALMRLTVISKTHYDTAFTLALFRVCILTSIIWLGALPFSRFYDDPRLFWLVCVLAVGAGARGLTSPRMAEFQKDMSFWRDFTMQLIGKAASLMVGSATALATGSYWSIAAGAVANPLAVIIISYCVAPYRPGFSLKAMPEFSGFVGWMSAAQMISALNWQSERLLLGRLQPKSELGLFATASDISTIPIMALFAPTIRPLLAAFSLVRNDTARFARSYRKASDAIMMLGLPWLVGGCLLADPAIRVVLGEAWMGAVPLMQWLSLSLIPGLFGLAAIPLVMSVGDTRIFLKRSTLEICVKMPILIVGAIKFGFFGIAVARAVSEGAAALYCLHAVRRLIGLSVTEQLIGPWRSFVATLVMAPVVIVCGRYLEPQHGVGLDVLQGTVHLMVTGGIGAAAYVMALSLLWLLSGRPDGVEAMVANALFSMFAKVRRPA